MGSKPPPRRIADRAIDVRAQLADDPVVGHLPADAVDCLARSARLEHYAMPTLLNAADAPLRWLRRVIDGHVEVIARRASGEEVALGDIGTGGWATWVACFSADPPDHDFYSSAGARYVAIPCVEMRSVCARHPEIFPLIISDLGVRMRYLMEWTGDSVLMSAPQRMAKLIQLLAAQHNLLGPRASVPVTQQRLAKVAGCSRQSANALLAALEARGLIRVAYGRCEIVDFAALRAFTETDTDAA